MFVELFKTFFQNLYKLYQSINMMHNDIKINNIIVNIDKNNKPKLYLIDLGRGTIPNLPLQLTIKNKLLNHIWNNYITYILKNRKRTYNNRTIKQIYKNQNKSHKVKDDLKFLIIAIMNGYRKLFNSSAVLINSEDIKIMKDMKYPEVLKYLIKKLDELL